MSAKVAVRGALARASRPAGAWPSTVVLRVVARRAARSGVGWGAVFGLYIATSAKGYATAYPTAAERHQLSVSLGSNTGLAALLGPARNLDTVAGFTEWRCMGVLSLVGAVWGLLAGTRLLRGEEDAGRWELLLAGQTTRRRAAVHGVEGLFAGLAALVAATSVITAVVGRSVDPPFSFGDAVFVSVALASGGLVLLATGALCSQLAATRRQAAAIAGAGLGVAFLIRMVADSGSRLEWLRWLSPLGWVEELKPLTSPRPVLLLPVFALVAVLVGVTVQLAGRRDLGASVLRARDSAPPRIGLLTGPLGLSVRLVRGVGIGWVAGTGAFGLVVGLVAQSAASAASGSSQAQEILGRLGAPHLGPDTYLGVSFLIGAALLGLVAAGQAVATREEEADGRVDSLLARPVARGVWLRARLLTALAVVVLCGIAAGVFAWFGTVAQNTGLSFNSVASAGVNIIPPAVFVLGVGTLVHALAPRAVAVVAYGVVSWSFLVEVIGSAINLSSAVLDTSVLHHVAPVPATDPDWSGAVGLVALGVLGATVAVFVFSRRDLVSA